MTEAGADWQLHAFGSTLHAFTNPEAKDPANGFSYSESATQRSMKMLADFLSEIF
jgi:dienelactone hydrolase